MVRKRREFDSPLGLKIDIWYFIYGIFFEIILKFLYTEYKLLNTKYKLYA